VIRIVPGVDRRKKHYLLLDIWSQQKQVQDLRLPRPTASGSGFRTVLAITATSNGGDGG
jgi:hypothetical protein